MDNYEDVFNFLIRAWLHRINILKSEIWNTKDTIKYLLGFNFTNFKPIDYLEYSHKIQTILYEYYKRSNSLFHFKVEVWEAGFKLTRLEKELEKIEQDLRQSLKMDDLFNYLKLLKNVKSVMEISENAGYIKDYISQLWDSMMPIQQPYPILSRRFRNSFLNLYFRKMLNEFISFSYLKEYEKPLPYMIVARHIKYHRFSQKTYSIISPYWYMDQLEFMPVFFHEILHFEKNREIQRSSIPEFNKRFKIDFIKFIDYINNLIGEWDFRHNKKVSKKIIFGNSFIEIDDFSYVFIKEILAEMEHYFRDLTVPLIKEIEIDIVSLFVFGPSYLYSLFELNPFIEFEKLYEEGETEAYIFRYSRLNFNPTDFEFRLRFKILYKLALRIFIKNNKDYSFLLNILFYKNKDNYVDKDKYVFLEDLNKLYHLFYPEVNYEKNGKIEEYIVKKNVFLKNIEKVNTRTLHNSGKLSLDVMLSVTLLSIFTDKISDFVLENFILKYYKCYYRSYSINEIVKNFIFKFFKEGKEKNSKNVEGYINERSFQLRYPCFLSNKVKDAYFKNFLFLNFLWEEKIVHFLRGDTYDSFLKFGTKLLEEEPYLGENTRYFEFSFLKFRFDYKILEENKKENKKTLYDAFSRDDTKFFENIYQSFYQNLNEKKGMDIDKKIYFTPGIFDFVSLKRKTNIFFEFPDKENVLPHYSDTHILYLVKSSSDNNTDKPTDNKEIIYSTLFFQIISSDKIEEAIKTISDLLNSAKQSEEKDRSFNFEYRIFKSFGWEDILLMIDRVEVSRIPQIIELILGDISKFKVEKKNLLNYQRIRTILETILETISNILGDISKFKVEKKNLLNYQRIRTTIAFDFYHLYEKLKERSDISVKADREYIFEKKKMFHRIFYSEESLEVDYKFRLFSLIRVNFPLNTSSKAFDTFSSILDTFDSNIQEFFAVFYNSKNDVDVKVRRITGMEDIYIDWGRDSFENLFLFLWAIENRIEPIKNLIQFIHDIQVNFVFDKNKYEKRGQINGE